MNNLHAWVAWRHSQRLVFRHREHPEGHKAQRAVAPPLDN